TSTCTSSQGRLVWGFYSRTCAADSSDPDSSTTRRLPPPRHGFGRLWTNLDPDGSRSPGPRLASAPRRDWIQAELRAHRTGQVFSAPAEGQAGDARAMLAEEIAHELRTLLRHLAQDPADRLADPEVALLEQRRRDLREEREVA